MPLSWSNALYNAQVKTVTLEDTLETEQGTFRALSGEGRAAHAKQLEGRLDALLTDVYKVCLRWPALKCVGCVAGRSHPGTPTPSPCRTRCAPCWPAWKCVRTRLHRLTSWHTNFLMTSYVYQAQSYLLALRQVRERWALTPHSSLAHLPTLSVASFSPSLPHLSHPTFPTPPFPHLSHPIPTPPPRPSETTRCRRAGRCG